MTTITKLKSDLFATGINPLNNTEIDEGQLGADTLVKDAVRIGDNVRFLASTDGGDCWYHQRADSDEFHAAAPDTTVRIINF